MSADLIFKWVFIIVYVIAFLGSNITYVMLRMVSKHNYKKESEKVEVNYKKLKALGEEYEDNKGMTCMIVIISMIALYNILLFLGLIVKVRENNELYVS